MNKELVDAGERLIATAEYISEHGHHQDGEPYGKDGSACVIGAWTLATRGSDIFVQSVEHKALQDSGISCVPTWSDNTSTEDVILTLKKTGTELINQGKQAL